MDREILIKKWLEGTLNSEEKIAFEALEDSAKLKRISNAMPNFKSPELETNKIKNNINLNTNKNPNTMLKRLLPFAALIVIALGITYFFNSDSTINTATKIGEMAKVDLPDKTKVTLNAGSTLTFDEGSWDENRITQLEGEAFFNVSKGSKFTVNTTQGKVTVLGTQFNVKQRNEFFEVHCYEGSVEVEHPLRKVILKPGEYISIYQKQVTSGNLPIVKAPSWTEGRNVFRGVPYNEILDELSRQYDVTITTDIEASKRLFTGAFNNDNLEEALKAVTAPLKLDYKITGKNVIIERK